MNRLGQEIRKCMSGLTDAGKEGLTARFLFPGDFVGFQGHFPERPVLPAVCKIQAAVAMLEAWKERRLRLDEIVLAKFAAPVTCDEEAVFLCQVTMEDSHRAVVRVTVTKHGDMVARFKLRVAFGDREQAYP
jgi:3-hydroxyacyl-[acyl-carrier-protein] dehydratase